MFPIKSLPILALTGLSGAKQLVCGHLSGQEWSWLWGSETLDSKPRAFSTELCCSPILVNFQDMTASNPILYGFVEILCVYRLRSFKKYPYMHNVYKIRAINTTFIDKRILYTCVLILAYAKLLFLYWSEDKKIP